MYFDPFQMIGSAQRLTKEGILMHEYAQTIPNLTESSQNLFDLIKGRNFSAYPDADIRLSISRAVAIETPRGWRIGKNLQSHKIDVVVALGMAALAATKREVAAEGWPLSLWEAVCNDGADPLPEFDQDGSREWRDRRCPPAMDMQTWLKQVGKTLPDCGPDAPGVRRLDAGGYVALRPEQRYALGLEQIDAERNKGRPPANVPPWSGS